MKKDTTLTQHELQSLIDSRLIILEPIPSCKYRLPCGNCDDLDMPCPVICQPWKEGEK